MFEPGSAGDADTHAAVWPERGRARQQWACAHAWRVALTLTLRCGLCGAEQGRAGQRWACAHGHMFNCGAVQFAEHYMPHGTCALLDEGRVGPVGYCCYRCNPTRLSTKATLVPSMLAPYRTTMICRTFFCPEISAPLQGPQSGRAPRPSATISWTTDPGVEGGLVQTGSGVRLF